MDFLMVWSVEVVSRELYRSHTKIYSLYIYSLYLYILYTHSLINFMVTETFKYEWVYSYYKEVIIIICQDCKKEVNELSNECGKRLEMIARNDGIYQNLQGQLIEKKKRITDYQNFIQMISKSDINDETTNEPREQRTPRKDT